MQTSILIYVTLTPVHPGFSLHQSLSSLWYKLASSARTYFCTSTPINILVVESWFYALGGCFCSRSEGEKIRRCTCESNIAYAHTSYIHICISQKHQDAFASAFGFFLIGYDLISKYSTPQNIQPQFFSITDPVLWFFKFTFASNAATIVGGCLVTNPYKLRMPAAFVSAFVISVCVFVLSVCVWF